MGSLRPCVPSAVYNKMAVSPNRAAMPFLQTIMGIQVCSSKHNSRISSWLAMHNTMCALFFAFALAVEDKDNCLCIHLLSKQLQVKYRNFRVTKHQFYISFAFYLPPVPWIETIHILVAVRQACCRCCSYWFFLTL